MPRNETLDSRVARLEEAIAGFKEDRIEARQDRKDIIGRLDHMTQEVQSTGAAVRNLSLEKCGERLAAHDDRIGKIEALMDVDHYKARLERFAEMDRTITAWKKWIGEGWVFAGRIILAVIASGLMGGTIFGIAAKVASNMRP